MNFYWSTYKILQPLSYRSASLGSSSPHFGLLSELQFLVSSASEYLILHFTQFYGQTTNFFIDLKFLMIDW